MRIELCEDNGMLNDGKPTLVVLKVTIGDKVMRLPYQADRTIQKLYEDVQNAVVEGSKKPSILSPETPDLTKASNIDTDIDRGDKVPDRASQGDPNKIEKEDIVLCVKAYPRDGNQYLYVGDEYRVINIVRQGDRVKYYELLDDKADGRHRIATFPEEIELKKKAASRPVKKVVKDIIGKCEECADDMSLVQTKEDKFLYKGVCPKCGNSQQERLPNPKKEVKNA